MNNETVYQYFNARSRNWDNAVDLAYAMKQARRYHTRWRTLTVKEERSVHAELTQLALYTARKHKITENEFFHGNSNAANVAAWRDFAVKAFKQGYMRKMIGKMLNKQAKVVYYYLATEK